MHSDADKYGLVTPESSTEVWLAGAVRSKNCGCKVMSMFILSIVCVCTFFCSFLYGGCALDLARDLAP